MSELSPFDIQVNGYAGADFNADELDAEDLERACQALRSDGVGSILATVITAELEAMERRLRRLVELRARSPLATEMIAGLHIEGPFISPVPGFVGAHPAEAVRRAELDSMKRLLEASGGIARLVTLAPEQDPGARLTAMLTGEGVCVSAGHTDASLDELRAAIDAGMGMFTHVGNGCPVEMHRHDNIVQRALSLCDDLWMCFIPDGVHIPFMALRNYLRCAELERCIFVTDAISAAGLGPGDYTLGTRKIVIGDDGIAWAADRKNFAGSTVTMPTMRANLEKELGLGAEEITATTAIHPRKALGLEIENVEKETES
ncbi:MAG: N-acetylglucosamine-6-phosphate deacetylase [Verrucomicrobiales bacterium]